MSSMLLARTSQRLKQLITNNSSNSSSKKSTNQRSASPNSSPASPKAPRRSSRPHSWISHASSRRCEPSYSPTSATSPAPRIEPPAIPKPAKPRTKSAGCAGGAGPRPRNGDNADGQARFQSKSESSLCCGRADFLCESCHGWEEGEGVTAHDACSTCSLSGRDAATPSSTSCSDATCRIRVPRKSSRRGKSTTPTPTLELFPAPPGRTPSASSGRKSGTNATRRPAQLSTLDLFEALELDPNEGLRTPTQESHSDSLELGSSLESNGLDIGLPLTRTAWSDDVEQLIRETDQAFKAVSFALSDAKEATGDFRAINWRPDLTSVEPGPESPKKSASMRMRSKQAAKTPLTRNASVKAVKPKRKRSKRIGLQPFPSTTQTQSPRWTLPEVTAELFGGRMFGRVEADEMLNSEESIQQARWSRESLMSEKQAEERKRESMYSQETTTSVETREEDRSTPVEPFHLEELSSRLSNVKMAEDNLEFETPRPSPMPPVPPKDMRRTPERLSDPGPSQQWVNTVLPPLPAYSPISPPTPTAIAVFNATAPLSPVSAVSPPLQNFHDNGTTDQDPLRFGRLKFPSPPAAPSPPPHSQPQSHRASRSRSVTRTSLATIRETSPIDPSTTAHSQSVPATPAKNRSPIRSPPLRSPPSSGTISPLTPPPGTPNNGVSSGASSARNTTLLHSALHRGFKQRSNSATLIASTEVISGSLSPRKITPFPSSHPHPSTSASTNTNGLISTPFSLTAPLFKHGSIRLNRPPYSPSLPFSQSLPSSAPSTGLATPNIEIDGSDLPEAQILPFDWTAFQMAISGGTGEYLMGGEDLKEGRREEEEEMEREREEIGRWWKGFGFKGGDAGMGRVRRGEGRRGRKKGSGSGDGKEKEQRRSKKAEVPQIVVAELEADVVQEQEQEAVEEEPTEKPRPFSFLPGDEELTSNDNSADNDSGSCSALDTTGARKPKEGYESEESLPDSPMEAISEGGDVLMGFNLGHDLPDFLRWESMNAGLTHVVSDRERRKVERTQIERVRSI